MSARCRSWQSFLIVEVLKIQQTRLIALNSIFGTTNRFLGRTGGGSGLPMAWEKINNELKRRSRVSGAYSNDQSLLRVAVCIFMDINEDRITGNKYLSVEE